MRYAIALLIMISSLFCLEVPEARAADEAAQRHALILPEEKHFVALEQLSNGGENAEAYWSWPAMLWSFRQPREMQPAIRSSCSTSVAAPSRRYPTGRGERPAPTSCRGSGDHLQLYAPRLAELPAPPDMSHGYTWAVYDAYDIFKARGLRRVCPTDEHPGLRRGGDGRTRRHHPLHIGRDGPRPLRHGPGRL